MTLISSNYDIIFYLIIALSAIWALFKGAVNELLSLAVWIFAFWFMRVHGDLINRHLPNSISNQFLRALIAFILFFIALAIIATIIKKILNSVVRGLGLGGLNCALGFAFGIGRGIIISAVLVIVVGVFNLDPAHSYSHSRVFPVLHPVINWISDAIPKKF